MNSAARNSSGEEYCREDSDQAQTRAQRAEIEGERVYLMHGQSLRRKFGQQPRYDVAVDFYHVQYAQALDQRARERA